MGGKLISWLTFWPLVVVFVVIASLFFIAAFIPAFRGKVKARLIFSIFWALVGVFVIIARAMFLAPLAFHSAIPFPRGFPPPNLYLYYLYSSTPVVLVGLGVTLIVLTVKTKVRGMLKGFLLLTGASAVGLFVSITLHNLVLGLLAIGLMRSSEPVFFLIAVFVCPIGFLVGVIGSVVLAVKNKPPKYSAQNI